MKKLWCLNFIDFKRIAYKSEWDLEVPKEIAIISINNGSLIPGEYHICKSSDNVLNLDFDDVDPIGLGLEEGTSVHITDERILVFFTDLMADTAIKFIENNKNKHFIIHCSAGISRSQAFVKYIKNVYDIDWETNPNNPCIYSNGFVYQKLMAAHRKIFCGENK